MRRGGWHCVLILASLMLAACGARRGAIETLGDAAHWRLEGRLAVSDGHDSGSGTVTWEQEGAYFMIQLRAPISGQNWRLSGDGALCTLEGLRADPLTADSPEALLERELGWHLPVAALRDWLQGRPMNDDIRVIRDKSGQISGFSESGWAVPTRISANKPPYQARLAIKSWVVLP